MDEKEIGNLTRRQFTTRALAAGVSMTVLPALLAACGGKAKAPAAGASGAAPAAGSSGAAGASLASAPAEKVTLQFWKFSNEIDDAILKGAVTKWNGANSNIQVKFETFPQPDYSATKLTTAFASGAGPDVFWMSPGQFINYVNNGIAAPLDDIVDKSAYNPASVKGVSVGGKMYALPFEQEPVGLYYRKDHFEAAGIKPPTTWDEFSAAAKALTTDKRKGVFIEVAPGPYQNFTWYPFLWSAGGEVVNADSTKSALRTPEAASAFDLWGKLVRDGYAPKKTTAITADLGPLARGECSMQVCGFWAIGQLKSAFPKEMGNIGIVALPAPAGGKPTTVYGGWTQMINAKSKHVEQAKAFTKGMWIDDNAFPEEWACRKGSKFSPRTAINDACADVFGGEPHKAFTDKILPNAKPEPRYPDQIVKAVGDGLQAVMFSGKTGEQAAAIAADGIDKFLSSYKGAPLNPEA